MMPPVIHAQTNTPPETEQGITHKLRKNTVTVVPDTMLRGYDPITVFFPSNRGPSGGGPLDVPGELLKLSPGHPGEYRWLDAKTLQFRPTIPWPALERFTVSVNGRIFNVSTLMAPPNRLTPRNSRTHLEPVKEIQLSFPHPIATEKLALMFTVEVLPLPGVDEGSGYWLNAKDFSIKEMERKSIKTPASYRVTFHKAIPYGKRINLHLRLSLDNNIPGSLTRYHFSTKPLFRLVNIGSDGGRYPVATKGSVYAKEQAMDGGSGETRLFLEFNDSPGTVSLDHIKKNGPLHPGGTTFQTPCFRQARLS